jgi:hypothetical protein
LFFFSHFKLCFYAPIAPIDLDRLLEGPIGLYRAIRPSKVVIPLLLGYL